MAVYTAGEILDSVSHFAECLVLISSPGTSTRTTQSCAEQITAPCHRILRQGGGHLQEVTGAATQSQNVARRRPRIGVSEQHSLTSVEVCCY